MQTSSMVSHCKCKLTTLGGIPFTLEPGLSHIGLSVVERSKLSRGKSLVADDGIAEGLSETIR